MRCETTVGTEKRRRLISVSLHAINYKCDACGEITYFNQRTKRVKQDVRRGLITIVILLLLATTLTLAHFSYNRHQDWV